MKFSTLGAATALILLAGCHGGLPGQNSTSAEAAAASEDGSPENAKLAAYTEAYNQLIDTFGLEETADRYEKADIASKSPTDNISITDGWLAQGLTKLDKALAMPGNLGPLDASAKTLRTALDRAQKHVATLDTYYTSKAYKDDKLARGKAEDAQMRSEFAAALSALGDFNNQLTTFQRTRDDKLLADYKAKGNMVAYNGKLALRQASDLIDLFKKPDDLKNAAVLAKGNEQVAALDKTLTEFRTAIDAAKGKTEDPGTRSNLSSYDQEAGYLTSLVGAYRELRDSHEISDHKSMIDAYNHAIDSVNRISN